MWDSGARYLLVCTSHVPGQSGSYMGRKEETCHGCLPCLPPIPSTHMSFSHQNLRNTHCLSPLLLPSLRRLLAALTPSPSRATAFPQLLLRLNHLSCACSVKWPSSPASTWRSSPYYAGFPCCWGPQGPLSSRHLQ